MSTNSFEFDFPQDGLVKVRNISVRVRIIPDQGDKVSITSRSVNLENILQVIQPTEAEIHIEGKVSVGWFTSLLYRLNLLKPQRIDYNRNGIRISNTFSVGSRLTINGREMLGGQQAVWKRK